MGYFESPNDYRNYLMHYGVRGMRWRNRPSRDDQDPDWFGTRRGGRRIGHTAQGEVRGMRWRNRPSRDDQDPDWFGTRRGGRRIGHTAQGEKRRPKKVRNGRNKTLDVWVSGRRDIHPLSHELLRRKQNGKHR